MAAAVLPNPSLLSSPFQMPPNQRINANSPPSAASSSRSQQPTSSSHLAPAPDLPESSSKTFKRLRSSFEQSLRTATRSRTKTALLPSDDFRTITPNKGKEKAKADDANDKPRMLRRLESKVGFRLGREAASPSPSPATSPANSKHLDAAKKVKIEEPDKVRAAGFTSFLTPSLRQASMSSPTLHLSSQPIPSSKPQPALPPPSSSTSSVLVTPNRSRRASLQPSRDISSPTPLGKRDTRTNGNGTAATNGQGPKDSSRDKLKHRPPPLQSLSPVLSSRPSAPIPIPQTPTRKVRDLPSPPDTPTPDSRGQLGSRRAAASASHLPLNSPSISPTTPRASSPIQIRARSPSTRRLASPTHRPQPSSSSSHLPLAGSPSPTPRRSSVEAQRRPSDSPVRARAASPSTSTRPRAASPGQASYSQNRHFNISTSSLIAPANPEQRELIRTATSILCKELLKPPAHLIRTDTSAREWDEVEVRLRALVRLERIWGKSGASAAGSTSQLSVSGLSSGGLSAGGEERERRLFCEALRDGYILCQLTNKLRPNSIARPNPREDGFVHTSNVTKFLAACSVNGLPSHELFHRDDLIESTPESLARVAQTIIALVHLVEAPVLDRSKVLVGQSKNSTLGPYNQGSSSRAASSTPNLSALQRSASPGSPTTQTSRKRWSPPSPGLPTVRSDSPAEISSNGSSNGKTERNGDAATGRETPAGSIDRELDEVPPIITPPHRSPLRSRSQTAKQYSDDGDFFTQFGRNGAAERASIADSSCSTTGESVRASVAESAAGGPRQSLASSLMTESTMYSSLLDVRQNSSSSQNKYATIRTVTTDATSLDSPSLTRTEGSSLAASLNNDDVTYKRGGSSGIKFAVRERKPSESGVIDLSRVAEEIEEASASGSSSKGPRTTNHKVEQEVVKENKRAQIHLGKAKWPDDFLDAFQVQAQAASRPSPTLDEDRKQSNATPIQARKKAAVGGWRNESVESLPQFPRRPTHRARHSVDAPVLLPKESILRRDVSPDNGSAAPRVVLRRNSTKSGPHRNGMYIPLMEDPRTLKDGSEPPVPFPRTASGEHAGTPPAYPASPSLSSSSEEKQGTEYSESSDKPRPPRGRFQSEIDGSGARRRARPNSYDELGNKPRRSRFESMVNLGAGIGSSNASASDLMSRDSLDGSAVRQTLIVKEEGKPPTHFQLGNCIGRGQFGSVYRALNLNTGQMVAVKRIRLEGLKEEEVTQLMREVDLVKSLSHPSIVKYEGMARDENTLSIVLEYVENGSLGQTLKAFGKLNERLVASYVVKILEGLHYLHQSEVVHCDLKAANILTTKNGNVKLSDFGVSLNLRAMERELKDVAGTPNWMAPEVIELKGASTKSDIWSLACTVIELLTGRPPYGEIANSMTVMFRIVEDDMPAIPEGCSESLQDFLQICFNKDPTLRPSAELLCEHEWLKKNWGVHKELRPQDSLPFLRRVSADLQKSEAVRYLSQLDIPRGDSPASDVRLDDFVSGSPGALGRRVSSGPSPRLNEDLISSRDHSFVKTTFKSSMTCRVCLLSVKKSAVLCEQCSLIAHSKCAPNAPPTCDLRAQLLLYAQYAEKGSPLSAYTNPLDGLNGRVHSPASPTSENSFSIPSARTSIDSPSQQTSPIGTPPTHPPTAFKFMAAFKRSRSSLSPEPGQASSVSLAHSQPSSEEPEKKLPRKPSMFRLRRNQEPKERPQSITSNSGTANTSSMRSAETAAESFSEAGRVSVVSAIDRDARNVSRLTSVEGIKPFHKPELSGTSSVLAEGDTPDAIPGDMPMETRRRQKKDTKGSGSGCIVQ